MTTLYAKAAGGNWSAAGTWSSTGSGGGDSSGPPTAADNIILESGSGNVTIDANSACRSLDCTSGTGNYAGTLTHNAGFTLSIGDATAGASNVALKLSSGMTYTKLSSITSALSLVSTSATQQTIDTAGKTTSNITFNATSNGSWILSSALTVAATATLTLTKGSLDTNGQAVSVGTLNSNNSNVRSLTLGASAITLTGNTGTAVWDFGATTTNLTFTPGTSTITFSSNNGSGLAGGGKTFYDVTFTTCPNTIAITGANTFNNLTLTGYADKVNKYTFAANQTINGTLTINGNSVTKRLLISSNVSATARTLTAATIVTSYTDFEDITGAGAANWNLTAQSIDSSGDCGGNSGITFTTAATQTLTGTSSGQDWSTAPWSGRVPLPQDNANITGSLSGGVMDLDMPRLGKNIDFTGASGDVAGSSGTFNIYGSLKLATGISYVQSSSMAFKGRSSYTITTCGKSTGPINLDAIGGTLTLQDNLTASGSSISLTNGTLDANNYDVACSVFSSSNSNTRTLTMGSGTWSLTGTSTIWSTTTSTGLTLNAGTSTIVISNSTAALKSFEVNSANVFYDMRVTLGSYSALQFIGGATYNNLSVTGTGTADLRFDTSTHTFKGSSPLPSGTAGNLINYRSTFSIATISCTYPVDIDYVSVYSITAARAVPFYSGTHSTDSGSNTNWTFTNRPYYNKSQGFLMF